MAIDTSLTYTITVRDRFGVSDSVTFYVRVDSDAVTVKEIHDDCQFFGTLVDDCCDAQIEKLTVTITPDLLDTYKSSPGFESFVSRQGLIPAFSADLRGVQSFAIPSADNSEISANALYTGGAVDALVSALETDSLTFEYTLKNGHKIVGANVGRVHVRKRRKDLTRSTMES